MFEAFTYVVFLAILLAGLRVLALAFNEGEPVATSTLPAANDQPTTTLATGPAVTSATP